MKRLCLAITLVALAGACSSDVLVFDWRANVITLPIEVLGPEGTTETVTIGVSQPNAAAATSLRLHIHALTRESKVGVRINQGAWLALGKQNARVIDNAQFFGGIGGPITTMRVEVAVPQGAVQPGANTLSFRYERSDETSIGFRVLAIDLADAEGKALLDQMQFRAVDPAQPPATVGDVARGAGLWSSAALRMTTGGAPKALRTHCEDCHAHDGRDLKYFGYSSRSIVERAKFYGLKQQDGQDIAAYIFALPVAPQGRPWNPPYQPGPGLDAKPLSAWAAGAGLDAVIETEVQAWAQLFPKGQPPFVIDIAGTLNVRELALRWPLPDWNQWLPRIHPADAWGDEFLLDDMAVRYQSLRKMLSPASGASDEAIANAIYNWSVAWGERLGPTKRDSAAEQMEPQHTQKLLGSATWMMVKTWELMQEFDLEKRFAAVQPARGERRSWPSMWPSAAYTGAWRNWRDHGLPALYWVCAWRHMQMLLNPRTRQQNVHLPVDWFAMFAEVEDLNRLTGLGEAARFTALMIKALQAGDNGIGPDLPNTGWSLTRGDVTKMASVGNDTVWARAPSGQRAAVLNAYARAWLAKATTYPASQYARAPGANGQSWYIEPADEMPGAGHSGLADRMYEVNAALPALGVDADVVQGLRLFATSLWPLGDWNSPPPNKP